MAEFTPAQARAIDNLATNVAVSAGAGAGKTRVLVERYVNILRQGQATCDQILAITFTNKAAKEMKERLRAKVINLALEAEAAEERQRWREVNNQLEYAPIGTFHSFCARILRENPVEAELDPNFAVLDQMEADLLLDKGLAEVLETALAAEDEWVDRLLGTYDKGLLDRVVPGLYEKLAAQGLLRDDLAERLASPYRRALAEIADLKADLSGLCRELIIAKVGLPSKSPQFARVERLERNWTEVAAAIEAVGNDDAKAYEVLHDHFDSMDRRSKDKEIVAAIKETVKALDRVRIDRAALALIPDWCELLLALRRMLDKYKSEHRALTFSDLEVRTARLLDEQAAVRQRYNGRIRQIMVDEFQDTNELQRQIVYLLAGGDADELRGEKLFVVGDAKQSIYRFRGADVTIFEQVSRDIVAAGGERLELDINFRSMDGLLAVYNECFAAIMGGGDDRVGFQGLQAHRCAAADGQIRAEFLALAEADLGDEQTGREAEAEAIARRIRAMVSGQEHLIDQDTVPRAVNFGDIALLFRTFKDVDLYAAALQSAGVPYYIVGGRGFYGCQEVADILNLLKVVENRFQEVPLAGVLRSPLFFLSDETLVRLKNHGDSLWCGLETHAALTGLAAEEQAAIARAWRILTRLRDLRGSVGVAELIRLALVETGYQNFVLTQFMGQQKYANLAKLTALASSFAAKGLFSLGDFLRYVAKLVAGEVQEGEAVIESESGNTVKLMTIHKAKGLEYPVVFVADLHRKFRDETAPLLFSSGEGLGLRVPVGSELVATSLYAKIAAGEKRLAIAELKRLLYVALTRAKDYLVLSGVGNKIAKDKDFAELNSWLAWLGRVYDFSEIAALPDRLGGEDAGIKVCPNAAVAPLVCRPPDAASTANAEPDRLARLVRNIGPLPTAAEAGNLIFKPTDIIHFRHCPRLFYYSFFVGLPEVAQGGNGGDGGGLPPQLIGTVLHRCLEVLDTEWGWEAVLASVIAEKVPVRWRRAVTAKAAPLLQRYVASQFHRQTGVLPIRKEWQFHFFLPDEGGDGAGYQFSGRIDGLVDYGETGCGIIDYKTDKVSAVDAGAKADEYLLQLVLYALAAEAALGRPVVDAKLYFLRPDLTVAVPVDASSRAAAVAEILSVCRHATRHEAERDYPCNLAWCDSCGYLAFCPQV
ncbi:MAG: UvrD-helicase domain-containing protein [Negativicutes bacterium]|nr:UvrD-helicase domain-containing protein [Negativicutes bacterium]